MPNFSYYEDVKLLKKPLKKRFFTYLKFFIFLIIFAGCFVCATFFSRALTVGNVSSILIYGDKKVKINKSSYYAIALGNYDNYEDAEKVALGSTVQGASGYIWEEDKYYVIGGIYPDYDSASSVYNNLKDSKYDIIIKEIEFPNITLNFEMYENKDTRDIENAFGLFDDIFNRLYDRSIKLDKGDITNLAVSSDVSSIRGDVKSYIIKIQSLLNKSSSELKYLQEGLIKLDEVLDQTILKTIDGKGANYSIRNSIAKICRIKFEMLYNLSN